MFMKSLIFLSVAAVLAGAIFAGYKVPKYQIDTGLDGLEGTKLTFARYALQEAEAAGNPVERKLAAASRVAWVSYDYNCISNECRLACQSLSVDPNDPLIAKVAVYGIWGVPLASYVVDCQGARRENGFY